MHKDIKWGNKELKDLSHDELNKYSIAYLQSIQNGIDARDSGQLQSVAHLGGKKTLGSGDYTYIQSMGGNVIGKQNVESGHLKSICSDGGKAGAKSQMEKKIGIHTADTELRRQWAILGGKKSAAALNQSRTCPHCGVTTAGGGYYRWHGDNCKKKNI